MRALTLLALAIVALPFAAASEPWVVLLDWQEGASLAPTTPFVMPPLATTFSFEVDACHPRLLLDLLYAPEEVALDAEGVGEAAVAYEFRVEVWDGDRLVSETRVQRSGYGIGAGIAEAAGGHEVRVSLAWGANVEWDLRMRGALAIGDPACNPPL